MSRHAIDIVKRPLLTEKGTALGEHGQYVFEVARSARKDEIKAAVEELYSVKVVSVNTMVRRSPLRRTKWRYVPHTETKRAIVRLKEGQAIELF